MTTDPEQAEANRAVHGLLVAFAIVAPIWAALLIWSLT